MYVTSESARADKRLVGAYVPKDVAAKFEQRARELNDPFADALSKAMELYVAFYSTMRDVAA
jgi:hypothetical protein